MKINDLWCIKTNYARDYDGTSFNDMIIDDGGNIVICKGYDAIAQIITNKLWFIPRDYPYDITKGISYEKITNNENVKESLLTYVVKREIFSINDEIDKSFIPIYGIKFVNVIHDYNDNKNFKVDIEVTCNSNTIISTAGNIITTNTGFNLTNIRIQKI